MGCSTTKAARFLTKDDMAYLVENTRFPQDDIKDWYKRFLYDCPNGKLTKKKFIKIYKLFFPKGCPTKFCERIYKNFDSGM